MSLNFAGITYITNADKIFSIFEFIHKVKDTENLDIVLAVGRY